MTYPGFPRLDIVKPTKEPFRDPYLFDTISQWNWASEMMEIDESYKQIEIYLDAELRALEPRLYLALDEEDSRPRCAALQRLVLARHKGGEAACLKFLDNDDEWDRYIAAECSMNCPSERTYSKLVELIRCDPSSEVVSAAISSIPFQPAHPKEKVRLLLGILDRNESDWTFDVDSTELPHPKDAALRAIEETLGTSFITSKLQNGVYAVPTRFDVPSLIKEAQAYIDRE